MMKTGEPSKNIGLIKFAAALLTLLIFGCNKNDISDLNNKQSEAKREPQWHPSISLSDDKNGSPETLGKSIASSGDTIHVLYSDFSYENRGDLFYKRSTDGGTNWQPMKKINNSKGGFGSPSIYCSGKNLGIIWIEGNDNDWYKSQVFLKRSTDGGTTWEKDVSLTDKNKRASFPVIAIQNDNFYLVWSDDKIIDFWKGNIHRRPKLKISRDAGQNWNNEVSIINSVKSSSYNIATSGDNVYLTWLDNDTKELKFKSSNNKGDIWGEEKFLLGTKDFFHVPDISASGSNVFILSNSYIRSSDYGSTWSAGTKLFDGDSYFFHCISSSENYVNVLWRDIGKYGENLTINHRRSTDYGLTWSDTFPLPEIEGTSDAPNITSSGNEIHTIWIDQHLKYSEILYRRFSSREIVKKAMKNFRIQLSLLMMQKNYS
ncbi:MAG: hypothetical protein IPM96_21195 [Ignavibacteria bacterium]|nr:hypothetical protein [Ignavibacteria bacterium]